MFIFALALEEVLVIGCSGGTGPRAVQGLVDGGFKPANLHILTRNPTSPTCLGLRDLGCSLVQGDLENAESTRRAVQQVAPQFVYVHGTGGDTRQRDDKEVWRAEILASALRDVECLAYNSAVGSGVARIESKQQCEQVFRDAGLPLAALRANLFMEELWKDYTRPGILRGTFTFSVPGDKPLYLTSVKDMGRIAALNFKHPGLRRPVRAVASDVRTPQEMATAFRANFKRDRLFYFISKFIAPELHSIINFYITSDLQVDMDDLADFGPLTSFPSFLEETGWFDPSRSYASLSFR